MLVKVLLGLSNVSAFIDVQDMEGGPWLDQVKSAILNSPNFILILSNGTLERCKEDFEYSDAVHHVISSFQNWLLVKRIIELTPSCFFRK